MRYETIKELSDEEFKRATGVEPSSFQTMVEVVEKGLRKFGRPRKLSDQDQVLLTLMYWREYRTEFHIGLTYQVSESTVCRTIQKIENLLIKSKQFHLPGKKELQSGEASIEIVLLDATEQAIERPKKKQRKHYSGKKRRHTQKAQVVANLKSKQIMATAFSKGSTHDFQLFKTSRSLPLATTQIIADSGYQGLVKVHENSEIPTKKSKLHPLTAAQKAANRALSRQRILIENILRRLKVFRILSQRYRNRRKRFGLRFNLIAAIYNLELKTTA